MRPFVKIPTIVKILSVAIISSSSVAFALEQVAYQLPITRGGVTKTRVAYSFWSGEYPGPVINVNANKRGTTTIKGYASLRTKGARVSCQIKNGIYHEWSETPNSAITYYSVTALQSSQALRDTTVDSEYSVPRGSTITNIHYQAEGYCGGTLRRPNGSVEHISASCDSILEGDIVRTTKPDDFHEQWLYLQCADGKKVFVQDKDLLSQPGIKEGQITGYGEVGP